MSYRTSCFITLLSCFVLLTSGFSQNVSSAHTRHALRDVFDINCGGKPVGIWDAKSDVGTARPSWIQLVGTTRYSNDASRSKIANANPNLGYEWIDYLATERYAARPHSFRYNIYHLASGYWDCEFYFAETYWDYSGQRIFSINANGKGSGRIDVLGNVKRFEMHMVRINAIYVSHSMSIKFERIKNDPMVSGIYCWKN